MPKEERNCDLSLLPPPERPIWSIRALSDGGDSERCQSGGHRLNPSALCRRTGSVPACFSAVLAARRQCAACQTAKQGLYTPDTRANTQILPPFQWLSFRPPNFPKALCWPWLVSILSSFSKPLLALVQLSSGVLMARGPFHRLADFTTSVRRGCMDLSQNRCQV